MLKHHLSKLLLALVIGHGVPLRYAVPVYVAGQFDAATTYYTLNHCRGCYEVNPLLKPIAKTPLVFGGIAIGDSVYLLANGKLYRRHRRLFYAVMAGEIALHIYCGVHNIKVVSNARN